MRNWILPLAGLATAGGLLAIILGAERPAVKTVEHPLPAVPSAGPKALEQIMDKLRPLHAKLGKPRPGDWLISHPETGQTFKEYLNCGPVLPTLERKTIFIQPLGQFADKQREVIKLAAEFIGRFYNLPVTMLKDQPLSIIPDSARRTHPSWGDKQVLSTYVLDQVLKPALPANAFALIAFTSSDLWPGEGWNFVFGQASLTDRVGVWSIYRFGDPAKGGAEFRLCLKRTIATGVHELGHMFTMQHCTAYECVMCGCNNLGESDRRPIEVCPECLGKVCWATHTDPVARFRKLLDFCQKQGLTDPAAFCAKSLTALGATPATQPTTSPTR